MITTLVLFLGVFVIGVVTPAIIIGYFIRSINNHDED
jgi:hypothetical protein